MSSKTNFPSVSVIINTDGRAKSLATCLESLRYLRYPNFEVVVVAGPTRDGTHELCESYGDSIRYAVCPERNLSQSRNISIAISGGEFLAFLDDDSVPEPEWLDDVMPAFDDPDVAVAGGFLHDHTGKSYQWTFGTVDRFGGADTTWKTAAPHLNFPGSFHYPHVMANSVFRRSAVAEVGGFDEEYEYFLDESDLIVRFVDAGFKVAQLDKGFVHHKYMPSHIRNEAKVLTSWYSVIKNKTYFSLLNAKDHASVDEIVAVVHGMIDEFRANVRWAIGENKLSADYSERFEDEVDRASKRGLQRGLEGVRRTPGRAPMLGVSGVTRFAPWLEASDQRCYVFVSKSYPPESVGGVGRYIHQLATEVARLGHQVHVLTIGTDHDRVDFEEGVWVHRICQRERPLPAGVEVPRHLWNFSRTMFEEAQEIASRRHIDAVYAPVWDVEGIAFLVAKAFPLVTSLQTTMASYLDANEEKRRDSEFMRTFARPVLALEKRMMVESDRIHAISHAIVGEIERQYDFRFDQARVDMIPLGLADWSSLRAEMPPALPEGGVRLCFVGRMEFRKGADVFLSLVDDLLAAYPQLHIDIVGNDRIQLAGGSTMRADFEKRHGALARGGRVVFHGSVSDEQLRGFYQAADLIVAPSRFESFGLVHLEGMMFGKPVIGCAIGGMEEVIAAGETGLLAQPGDAASLRAAIVRLVEDADLRTRLGQAGRARYLSKFQPRSMAEGVIAAFNRLHAH
ncbi:glycosyltransferase [Massilia pinisoli]|uniref:Glycosyltransferase n=1 Tax=Massilia pinisoli TaxID=1772194 RepID=A0ABT1ZQ69_9BURK|nr:glycosyltransferase [Massilia pinisoli]MCS0582071.1 glycosyltransferase [Massilia pinisoli]